MKNKYGTQRGESLLSKREYCYFCGSPNVVIHHIYNHAFRQKSDELGCWVYLCPKHHEMIHANPQKARMLKKLCQIEFEEKYSHEEYMKNFRRNYL